MNRLLPYLNLCGVIVLAGLCGWQWQANRQLNLEVNGLEKSRFEQTAKAAEQEKTIQGYAADLESFRGQVVQAHASANGTEAKLSAQEHDLKQLVAERDQLQTSLTNWVAAIKDRDDQLKRVNAELKKLGDDRNDVVTKFNALAQKHNDTIKHFNELIVKYNRLVEQSAATNSGAKN